MDINTGAKGKVNGGRQVSCQKNDALEVLELTEENLYLLEHWTKGEWIWG